MQKRTNDKKKCIFVILLVNVYYEIVKEWIGRKKTAHRRRKNTAEQFVRREKKTLVTCFLHASANTKSNVYDKFICNRFEEERNETERRAKSIAIVK